MKKSRTFVPTTSRLEDRVALSGVTAASPGLPVLTARAAQDVTYGVNLSYYHFTRDSHAYGHLINDLDRVVSRIPYATRDGLTTTLANDVAALHTSLDAGTRNALITSRDKVGADIENFIVSELTAGVFIYP